MVLVACQGHGPLFVSGNLHRIDHAFFAETKVAFLIKKEHIFLLEASHTSKLLLNPHEGFIFCTCDFNQLMITSTG